MKHNAFTRILSMILVLCMITSLSTTVFATEPAEPEAPAETIVEPAPSKTEPVEEEPEERKPVDDGPIDFEPVETVPVETEPEEEFVEVPEEETVPEETVPEETEAIPEETVAEETAPEETVAALPYGLKGLPEGYVLSDEAMASKAALSEYGVVSALATAEAGVAYAANEIIVEAADEAEAQLFAEAYNGQLAHFRHGVAVITLSDISVAEAVSLSAQLDIALPAAYPNEIVRLNPITDLLGESDVSVASLPERKGWDTWVLDTMTKPDPLLLNPLATQYDFENSYQWHHDVIDTYAAWGVTTGNSFVKVAVLDTGVNASHKELAGRVESYQVNSKLGAKDDNGHGSHVAGLIAASMDNGAGGAGVAPGVTIQSFKVLDAEGGGTSDDIIEAVYLAVEKDAWIINMSLGGYIYNYAYEQAIKYAYDNGVTVIVAMGNDSSNIKCYPAAFSKYVIAVGASDYTNNRTFFSNWGSWIDVSAPGYNMWSTGEASTGHYRRMSGTSQATPVVAGVAALYMSANGWVDPATMEKVLESSCVKGGSNLGKGIVNAANMFAKNNRYLYYLVTDMNGEPLDESATVPCDSMLYLYCDPVLDENGKVVYTINGKNPSIKNGEIVNGTEYTGPISLEQYAGKTITVKGICINGVGVAGRVNTLKLKVSTSSAITGVTMEGPTKLVSGKGATYTAKIAPEKATQTVTWSIVDREGMASAKISSKGKLTTNSKQEGWVIIRATSTINTSKYAELKVYSEKVKPVATIALNQKTATLKLSSPVAGDNKVALSVVTLKDSAKVDLDPALVGIKWTSSKESVATVDKNGNVVAVAPGTATITAAAQDGSGKKATCKVTVKQLVEGIAVNGNVSMAPGSSATYKAVCYPTNASSKSVTWSLQGAPSGAKIDSKGKVTLPKGIAASGSFMVVATAKDGSGVMGSTYVKLQPKCTGLSIDYTDQSHSLVTKNSSGYVSSVVLYSMERDYYSGNDTDVRLYAIGKTATPAVKWSSSKPTVATVDENGYVKAVAAGTAKITATAQDGSGKKATITVTVRNHVSSMSIKSSALRSRGDEGYIAFGKSVTNTVTFADTFGVPTNKAVTWSVDVYEVNSSMNITANYTSYFKNQGWVKLSSSGKLTTSKKIENFWLTLSGELVVLVTATSKDNPNVSADFMYFLTRPATKMYSEISSGWMNRNEIGAVDIYCNVWRPWGDIQAYEMTATSSNPEIVGAIAVVPYRNSSVWYQLQFASGNKRGKATITVKAGDGSGKTAKIKVEVR